MDSIDDKGDRGGGGLARQALLVASIAFALAVGLFVLWIASTAFFVIFAGLLLSVVFDAAAGGLGHLLGWRRRWRLLLVVIIFFLLVAGIVVAGGATLVQQFGQLTSVIEEQIGRFGGYLDEIGISVDQEDGEVTPEQLRRVFGGAAQFLTGFLGAVSNAILVMFLAVFFAWEPKLYKSALVSLVPRDKRARFAQVLVEARSAMAWWMAGQGISMTVIFLLTLGLLMLVGMQLALLLAVQAGLLAFIPIIGPVIAGVVIVVVGLAQSPTMALYGLGAYLLIQMIESNLLAPVVQEKTVRLPPAFTLGFQLLMGFLFGFLGLVLAVPIAAAGKIFLQELYVKDRLGGFWDETE